MNRSREAAERFAERRRREDAAPRLRDAVPRLSACRIELTERAGGAVGAEVAHIRRVVVEHAPALFIIPCGDPACKGDGHDLTNAMLRGLREHQTDFSGEDSCSGYLVDGPCKRILFFRTTAEYTA